MTKCIYDNIEGEYKNYKNAIEEIIKASMANYKSVFIDEEAYGENMLTFNNTIKEIMDSVYHFFTELNSSTILNSNVNWFLNTG